MLDFIQGRAQGITTSRGGEHLQFLAAQCFGGAQRRQQVALGGARPSGIGWVRPPAVSTDNSTSTGISTSVSLRGAAVSTAGAAGASALTEEKLRVVAQPVTANITNSKTCHRHSGRRVAPSFAIDFAVFAAWRAIAASIRGRPSGQAGILVASAKCRLHAEAELKRVVD
jgi:hypothetical protein